MARRKVAPVLLVLISLVLISSFLISPYPTSQVKSVPLGVKPQTHFAPPSSQTGNGFAMSFEDHVNGWQANKTVKANNTLSGYQQRNAPPFTEPTPSPYTKGLQYLTVSNLTATYDVREVQYGTVQDQFSIIAPSSAWKMLAMRFTVLVRSNLTAVWAFYTSSGGWDSPVAIMEDSTGGSTPVGSNVTSGLAPSTSGSWAWTLITFAKTVTLDPTKFYWLIFNGTSVPVGKYLELGGMYESVQDNKLAAGVRQGATLWLDEPTIASFDFASRPFNYMVMLKVLAVGSTDASKVRTYSSPSQVAMNETNSNTQLLTNTTLIPAAYSTFALRTNTSVTFAVNWTAEFAHLHLNEVSSNYVAQDGFTQWTVNFTSGAKPNPTTYPYTWFNRMFRITTTPQFWNGTAHPPTVWNNQSYAPSPSFTNGSGYYQITQMNNINTDPWNAKWGISIKSTYTVTASMPSQVVVGLPLTLNMSTTPYTSSLSNVSFYNPAGFHSYSRNIFISTTSALVTLRLNETGTHTLFLFYQWSGGNEVSLNNALTINVLPADCNVTVKGRTSPVIGNTGALNFTFYNTTLGNRIIQPPFSVSINGTLTSNFVFDSSSGNTTVYLNTASPGWRTGSNTLIVSAKSGVYNATKQTWIVVQRPLSNVTFISVNQPFLGGTASLGFKFFNKTLGASPLLIDPASVKINDTSVSSTYSSGVVTTTWNTATGGWHVGLNHVNVSATRGIFSNYTVVVLTIIKPLSNVTVNSINQPILGDPATAQFRFRNGTNGWLPMSPISVRINGTVTPFTYLSGVTTVSWGTVSGGWRSGLNHVNITAIHGVFSNFTVVQINIIQPTAKLTLDAISYSATYGDLRQISFMLLNTTLGSSSPLPAPALYFNGSVVVYVHWTGAWYNYTLDTAAEFGAAQNWYLNFTAVYGEYVATNLTSVAVAHIPMQLSVLPGQTSVNVDSSYSVKANLTYTSGAPAPDGCTIRFVFSVTYTNGTVLPIVAYGTTTNGVAEASLLATSGMQSVAVEVFYDGSLILHAANKSAASIRVTVAAGLSIQVLLGIGVGGALVVIIPLAVIVRRRRSRETETRKTSVLRQTASLAQLIVVHLASGRSLFSRTIGSEEGADPNLISGFLSANQTLIGEVFKKQSGAGLKFADYGDYKVISDLGKHVMVTLFATETAGKELKDVLQSFTAKFENKYAKALESWDGDMNSFKDADALADEVFCLPLTAPYMLLENTSAKLGKVERMAVHSAKIISAERGVFFMPRVIDYLLTKQGIKRGKAMDVINSLTDKGIFRQLTVDQAAQVIKSYTEKAGAQE